MAKAAVKLHRSELAPEKTLTREDFDGLSGAQQDEAIDRMIGDAETGTMAQRAFFRQRREAGLGVGLDKSGRLVAQASVKG